MAESKVLLQHLSWCKGCGVCVGFCPKQVLKIEDDKCVIAYPDKCIFCGQCELRCPDCAIYIGGNDEGL